VFKDLNWGPALKRAATFVVIWLGLVYGMSVAFPESFAVSRQELPGLALNAVMFFFLFAFIFAITEKRRTRRAQELQAQKKGKPGKPEANGEASGSSLKGQRNPNTSRKKARRKR
jgi:hypothetical protein